MKPVIPVLLALLIAAVMAMPSAGAHEGEEHSHAAAAKQGAALAPSPASADGGAPTRQADGGLWVPKPVQHRIGVRTLRAVSGSHAMALTLNGKVIADPNAGGRVQASQAGRIEAGPQGLPRPGQRVGKGQLLAYLHPSTSSLERGNQIAVLAELDAQYAVAERKLARYEQLEGAIPRKDIEAARDDRDALKKRRAAIGASVNAPQALRAPVSGTLASAPLSIGQMVDARELLFEVVDTARLMVEALAYEPALAQGLGEASAPLPDGRTLLLKHVGGGLRLQDQALPLLFRITQKNAATPLPTLAIGQPLQVNAATSRLIKGVAMPRTALVRNASGDTVVWLHTAPEQFTPRAVQHQALDARQVVVTSGLQGGERVVTEGASLLAQIR
jgi:cobalt-zinc-cadmium efflux system membrane fusion protein